MSEELDRIELAAGRVRRYTRMQHGKMAIVPEHAAGKRKLKDAFDSLKGNTKAPDHSIRLDDFIDFMKPPSPSYGGGHRSFQPDTSAQSSEANQARRATADALKGMDDGAHGDAAEAHRLAAWTSGDRGRNGKLAHSSAFVGAHNASSAAHVASADAWVGSYPGADKEAARLHNHAAELHEAIGNHAQAELHRKIAEQHTKSYDISEPSFMRPPQKAAVTRIPQGRYHVKGNRSVGKAHMLVKADGSGIYVNSRGETKPLTAKQVASNHARGMNYNPGIPSAVSVAHVSPAQKKAKADADAHYAAYMKSTKQSTPSTTKAVRVVHGVEAFSDSKQVLQALTHPSEEDSYSAVDAQESHNHAANLARKAGDSKLAQAHEAAVLAHETDQMELGTPYGSSEGYEEHMDAAQKFTAVGYKDQAALHRKLAKYYKDNRDA